MGESEASLTRIHYSMLNTSTVWGPFVPVSLHASIAAQSGYEGIEYYPYRIPHLQVETHGLSENEQKSIKSAHQSFRTEKTLKDVARHPRPLLAAQAYVSMAEKFSSLEDLQLLQESLGTGLPLVVIPHEPWRNETRPALFSVLENKLIEPTVDLMKHWNVYDVKALAEMAKNEGSGIALDLFNVRRFSQRESLTPQPWQETIPVLLPYTKEIHLSLNRTDFEAPLDSQLEFIDLLHGTQKTEIVPILEMIRDSGWRGPIVTEIQSSLSATPQSLIRVHSEVVKNLKSIMHC